MYTQAINAGTIGAGTGTAMTWRLAAILRRLLAAALTALTLSMSFTTFALVTTEVRAEPVTIHFSATEIRVLTACESAGGAETAGSGDGGYGCYTDNCDGKGGSCIVDCFGGGNCTGITPGPVQPARGVVGLLGGLAKKPVKSVDSLVSSSPDSASNPADTPPAPPADAPPYEPPSAPEGDIF